MADGDFRTVVIGSGISGLFVALEAARLGPVLVVTKGSIDDCNTRWAQGGIAAAIGPLDSTTQHLADTIAAGAGLVDEEAARILCEEAPGRIRDLIEYGVAFDTLAGEVALGREAAHGTSRILHAGGDRTGAAIETALSAAAQRPSIAISDFTIAASLVVERGRVTGVRIVDAASGATSEVRAPDVVLATGGAGQLFAHTTNPAVATGDGVALAFEAGADVVDLEFYQFHPTALALTGAPPFLISEAVRGEGAVLLDAKANRFMPRYHPLAELAPRDIVAGAIADEMRAAGTSHVLLDCTGIRKVDLAARFPGIYAQCLGFGIDIRRDPIPVAPAAHYLMGGVRTDTWGRTSLEGLLACGEVACTGVHGANRLASNSLMETVVFGKRVVEHLATGRGGRAATVRAEPLAGRTGALARAALQRLMWDAAGIARTGEQLEAALTTLDRAASAPATDLRARHEDANLAVVARILLTAALRREESRGAHRRADYPERDDARWRRHQVFRRAD